MCSYRRLKAAICTVIPLLTKRKSSLGLIKIDQLASYILDL